jgi:hypothetical protein
MPGDGSGGGTGHGDADNLLAAFGGAKASCRPMSLAPPTAAPVSPWPGRLRGWALKAGRLVLVGVLFGWGYAWAAPKVYRPDAVPGFWLGCAHGALMPVALPSLLLGKDVPIYAERNKGRSYKLGYIAGINCCGFVFFGLLFWQPRRGRPEAEGKRRSAAQ